MLCGIQRFSVICHRPEHTSTFLIQTFFLQELIGMICIFPFFFKALNTADTGKEPEDPAV